VPTFEEMIVLIDYLGGDTLAGKKMGSTTGWDFNNVYGYTNESGFTGLPGGYRSYSGNFNSISNLGAWWGRDNSPSGWRPGFYLNFEIFPPLLISPQNFGRYVRCIKD
jgi:uncharacterized protein (TIGR02145 family)